MNAEIDSLEIRIQNDSSQAASSIDRLVMSLGSLKSVTKGGAGLTTVTNQITKLKTALSGIQLNTAPIAQLKMALNGLGSVQKSAGLTSTVNALQKLPKVAAAINTMDLDRFTADVRRLTAALAPLATEIQKVSAGFAVLPKNINATSAAANSFGSASKRSSGGIGAFAGKIGLIIGAITMANRGIGKLVQLSSDYTENLNLFTVSMGKYADEALVYAEKVSDVLGIDMSDWIRTQGIFMTLATGFGIAGEKAAFMSRNLTQLTYDIASFFNISVDDAAQKLQSGIAGELEPLRRLGYDLSQAELESVAFSLGIDKSVASMTQAEKTMLRYYAIMTQVTQSQGDMARTLDAPANQLRILAASATQAGRALGNLFIPALNKILPYAIAVMKVIKWVADGIASLFGIETTNVDYSGLEEIVTGGEEAEDALSGAAGAAKELKRQVMGFDELNILQEPKSGGGSGGGDIGGLGDGFDFELPGYDNFLDGAVNSRITEVFETIKGFVQDIFDLIPQDTIDGIVKAVENIKTAWDELKNSEGFKKFIEGIKEFVGGQTFGALESLVGVLEGLADVLVFIDGLLNQDWGKMWEGLNGFISNADKAHSTPLLGFATGSMGFIGKMLFGDEVPEWWGKASTVFGEGVTAMVSPTRIPGLVAGKMGDSETMQGAVKKIEEWKNKLISTFEKGWDKVAPWIKKNFIEPFEDEFKSLSDGIKRFTEDPIGTIKDLWNGYLEWFKTSLFTPFTEWVGRIEEKITSPFKAAHDKTKAAWNGFVEWFETYLINPLIEAFVWLKENIVAPLEEAWNKISLKWIGTKTWFKTNVVDPVVDVFVGIKDGIAKAFEGALQKVQLAWLNIKTWFKTNVIKPLQDMFSSMKLNVKLPKFKITWDYDVSPILAPVYKSLFGYAAKPKLGIDWVNWSSYAEGGYGIPNGQVFIANEAGPELVGQMNGRNTVANQEQIIEGIRQATYEGFLAAMAGNSYNEGNSHIVVKIGEGTLADVVVRALNKQTQQLGYSALEGI